MISKVDGTKIWHQKLGHLNLKNKINIISEDVVRGLLKLKIEEGKICGECQIGKETKMSHKKLWYLATSKVLELFHIDLMGPIRVESLSGKLCVFMCVNGFSRYTWVKFIK